MADAALKQPEVVKPDDYAEDYWENPVKVKDEIDAGDLEKNRVISQYADMLRRFQGPGRLEMSESDFVPYNFYYEFIRRIRPQIAFQNPVVRVKSKKPEVDKMKAVALEYALNRWIRDTHYIRTIERATTHAAFAYGVTMTTLDYAQGDYDDPRSRPRKIVLDPAQFGMDALARSWEESRIFWHRCVEEKADLIKRAGKEEGWDLDAVRAMPTSSDVVEVGRPKAVVDRGEVTYWEVWVPGKEDEDQSETHGRMLTLADCIQDGERKPKFLRKARDYYGPRWGPYTIWGFYFVPRSAWPMGPLQAQEGISRLLNAQAKVNIRRAKNRKDLMIYPQSDQASADRIAHAKDMEGVGISGFEKSKFEYTPLGGVNEDELTYEQWLDNLAKRTLGISDAELAVQGGGATATHDAIAASSSAVSISFMEQQVYDAVKRDLTTVAYFYWKEDTVVEPLGEEFSAELAKAGVQMPPGAYAQWEGGEKGSFDDLEFEIEPYSMRRQDETTQQAMGMQLFQLALNVAPVIPDLSLYTDLKSIFNDIGKVMGYPNLGDRFDFDAAKQIGALHLQLQAQPPESGGGSKTQGPPRMSSDVNGGGGPARLSRPSELGKGSSALPGKNSGAKAGHAAQGAA